MTPDEDYLETVAREQQAAAYRRDREHDDRCTPCGHTWHGLACTAQGAAFPCGCPTSWRATA